PSRRARRLGGPRPWLRSRAAPFRLGAAITGELRLDLDEGRAGVRVADAIRGCSGRGALLEDAFVHGEVLGDRAQIFDVGLVAQEIAGADVDLHIAAARKGGAHHADHELLPSGFLSCTVKSRFAAPGIGSPRTSARLSTLSARALPCSTASSRVRPTQVDV